MAENEIPNASTGFIIPDYFYRVIVFTFLHDPASGEFLPDMQEEEFKSENLLESKERALRYFMDVVTTLLKDGKYILPYKGEIDWHKCIPEGYKVCLSLICTIPDGSEEDFMLIGGSDEEMADARMEEEITMVIYRKSGRM